MLQSIKILKPQTTSFMVLCKSLAIHLKQGGYQAKVQTDLLQSLGFGHFYLSSKSITGQLTGDLHKTVMSELLDNILPKTGHWNNTQKKINNTCYYTWKNLQKTDAKLKKKKAFA